MTKSKIPPTFRLRACGRLLLFITAAFLAGCTASGSKSGQRESSATQIERPNIIFIFADDLGWGDLSLRGHEFYRTPNIDQMARDGIDFQQFTVANPVCSPSRTAVMTGHFPARHSVHQHFADLPGNERRGMPDWLDPSVTQLPRLLQEAGYATGHFGKWHLTNIWAKDAPLPIAYGYDESAVFNGPGPQANPSNSDVDDKTIDFIERHKDQAFFINVWLHETHTAHFPKEPYLQQFAHLDEPEQIYAAVLAEADSRVGRIMEALEANGLSDNTLVIFSSDNGPERQDRRPSSIEKRTMESTSYAPEVLIGYNRFASTGSSGGLRSLKRSLYEGGIRVPFIVRWPAQTPAGKVDTTTVLNAVDLLPTFAELAGVRLPDDYRPDGESMVAALTGQHVQRSRPIFWNWRGSSGGDYWPRWAVRHGDWKLLMTDGGTRKELYHIPNDPDESNNLVDAQPELAGTLEQMLVDWAASLPESPPESAISSFR